MALTNSPVTGTMKYLTIGENTYEIVGSSGSGNGTVTSVGVSNATNGGLSISGSPITTSGSITIGHSNVLTNAQTTSGLYPIKIDKNGHISQYGSAITSLPASDVSAWAKESTKPSYTASQVGAATWDHVHGNITNGGDITATAPTIASGDQIIINDNSASKITNGPSFGTSTTTYLRNDGSWATPTDTDEKLKTSALSQNTTVYHPILTTSETSAENKKYSNCLKAAYVDSNYNNYYLQIGNGVGIKGSLKLSNTGSTGSFTTFSPSGTTGRTLTLPDATGTVALTSDIPTVPTNISSFTNDSGYTTNTGTVTSVGLSNATNGGLSVSGSPVTSSGSITIGHSNVLSSAQTTQALYPIKIDKNGHVSAYGTAVTSLPASDVSSWAKASSKPSYTASEVSAVALSDKYTRSSAGDLAWTGSTDGDAKVIAKSALAFWNGAYSGTSSNLSRCSTGAIIGSNGGTMTGQLLTSFKSAVAVGSYGTAQTTLPNFVEEVRFSSGCVGSVNITTAYTKNNVTVSTGWYNFLYSPHRSGGVNGTASGDNCDYGTLILAGMTTDTCGTFFIRVSNGAVQSLRRVACGSYRTTFTPTSGNSYGNYGGCYYEYSGHIVHVHLGVMSLTANTVTTVYTLPADVRPTTMIFAHGNGGTRSNIANVEINTDGLIQVSSQGTYCGADITYMI